MILRVLVAVLLTASVAYAGSAELAWDPYTPPADFKEFRVYRGTMSCNVQGPLAPLVINNMAVVLPKPASGPVPTGFLDTTVPNIEGDVCYEVSAADNTGNEGRSNRATKRVDFIPPQAPTGLTVKNVTP